jgi:acyl-CoA thioesterase
MLEVLRRAREVPAAVSDQLAAYSHFLFTFALATARSEDSALHTFRIFPLLTRWILTLSKTSRSSGSKPLYTGSLMTRTGKR